MTAMAGSISIATNGSTVYFQETDGSLNTSVRSLGQTFQVPTPTSDNILNNFSFYFSTSQPPDSTFDYRGMIFEFNTGTLMATGPALFSSAVLSAGSNAPSFTGLSLALTPGTTYIALLTTQSVVSNGYSNGFLSHNSDGSTYTDGAGYQQSSTDPNGADWTTTAWTVANGAGDFQFTAEFVGAAVPEPSTLGFGLVGLLLTAAGVRRRRVR